MTKTASHKFLQKVSPWRNAPRATCGEHDQLRELPGRLDVCPRNSKARSWPKSLSWSCINGLAPVSAGNSGSSLGPGDPV
jgi:hypothetical protein